MVDETFRRVAENTGGTPGGQSARQMGGDPGNSGWLNMVRTEILKLTVGLTNEMILFNRKMEGNNFRNHRFNANDCERRTR